MKKFFYVFMSILICVSMLTSCQNTDKASDDTTEPSTTPSLTTDLPPITTEQPPITTEQPLIKTAEEWLETLLIFDASNHVDDFIAKYGITIQNSYSFDELLEMDKVILNRLLRNESNYIEKVNAVYQLTDAFGYRNLHRKISKQFKPHLAEPFDPFNSFPGDDYNNLSYYSERFDRCDFSFNLSYPEYLTQEEMNLIKKWNDFLVYIEDENNKEKLLAEQLPYKYIFIRDFEVSKEDFLKLNTLDGVYSLRENQIEILFCGNTDTIKRTLSYHDICTIRGKMYKAIDIGEEEFENFIINSDFITYLKRCAISSTSSSDDYDRLIKYYIQYKNITNI